MQIQFTPVCPLGYWYPFCYIVQYDEPAPLYEERISISEKPIACTGLWPLCAFDNFVSLEVAFEIEFTDTTVRFCISFPLILLRAVEQKMGVWCMGLCLCAYVCVEGGVYVLVHIWSGCRLKDVRLCACELSGIFLCGSGTSAHLSANSLITLIQKPHAFQVKWHLNFAVCFRKVFLTMLHTMEKGVCACVCSCARAFLWGSEAKRQRGCVHREVREKEEGCESMINAVLPLYVSEERGRR